MRCWSRFAPWNTTSSSHVRPSQRSPSKIARVLSSVERASVQGFADLLMGLMGAIGSAAGGMILGIWGFAILNAVGAALVLGPLAVALMRRPAVAAQGG